MKGYEKVIIIDAVRGGKRPGSIYRLTSKEIIQQPQLKLSGHQIDFPEVIHIAEKLGELPEMVLIGVEHFKIDYGMELSREVKKVTSSVIQSVLKETGMTLD
jgi:hydrogenase maturation protease